MFFQLNFTFIFIFSIDCIFFESFFLLFLLFFLIFIFFVFVFVENNFSILSFCYLFEDLILKISFFFITNVQLSWLSCSMVKDFLKKKNNLVFPCSPFYFLLVIFVVVFLVYFILSIFIRIFVILMSFISSNLNVLTFPFAIHSMDKPLLQETISMQILSKSFGSSISYG